MKIPTFFLQFIKLVKYSNLLKTVYLNFISLPLYQAIHLPILVGRRVKLFGIRRGCIVVKDDNPKIFSIMIGVPSKYSIYAPNREHSMFRFSKKGNLIFGVNEGGQVKHVRLLSGCSMTINGNVKIGTDVILNQHCTIYCSKQITIGNHVGIGWNTQIMDSDLHFLYDAQTNAIKSCNKPIIISDNVWIGNSCSIQKGVVIPPQSTIASRSLVINDFSNIETFGNLFAGSPAKLIKTGLYRIFNLKQENELKDYFSKNHDVIHIVQNNDNFLNLIGKRR